MPQYSFKAVDVGGAEQAGIIEAPQVEAVVAQLRQRGLFPVAVDVAAPLAVRPARRTYSLGRAVQPKELAVFTRQVATLLRAGLPLLRALEVLGRQQANRRFRAAIEALGEGIRGGNSLSEAMRSHPAIFPRIYVNLVRAGEAGGALDQVLDRLAGFQEKSLQLRGRVRAALVYPLIVVTVALLILAGLLVFVVPKFRQIFADLLHGAPLPPLTQAVLAISTVVQQHALLLVGLLVSGGMAFAGLRRTAAGTRVIDTAILRLPVFGGLVLRVVVARFTRTLGTLLASDVPILGALLIARDTCGNSRIAGAVLEVHDRVKAGSSVGQPLEETGDFPPLVGSMIEVGEQTGRLAEMLNKVADIYEEEVDSVVAGLSALIEPMLILFLAMVVGTIVIALFLPIIRIVQLMT